MIEELLAKYGLTYEDLDTPGHSGEKEYLFKLEADLKKNALTVEGIRDYISSLREGVERELVDEPELKYIFIPNRKHLMLKARLKNYLLLELFLSTPEKLKAEIERNLQAIK